MASCPKCGNGLPDGAGHCPVCGTEVVARGSKDDLSPKPASTPDNQRLVTVRSFSGPRAALEADLVKNFLQAEGIPCMLPGEGSASVLPGVNVLNLLVREGDAEQAAEILKSFLDTPLEDAGD
ncbi:MAG TPA: DUF2007 domain-containing protein [Terriglobia bacterium]|nr:DUF2007 domain-containing protein [Terriglobia bacterium]